MTLIRNSNRVVIQRQTTSNGTTSAFDNRGVLVGRFDSRSNRTYDNCGRLIGYGNLLTSLA